MRALVTGGAGFIGSHLCDYLLSLEHEVICMDDLITGTLANISHIRSDKFTFIKHDVTEYIDVAESVDLVFHFASPASPIDYLRLPIQTLKVGGLGTHKTLGLAEAKRAAYVLASTSEIYGDPLVSPQNENYWGNVNPVGPRGVYDEAKRFAEAMTIAYHKAHGVNSHIARIFNTFGPRMRLNDGRVVPTFIYQALRGEDLTIFGDGSQTRSFCFISDLIEGIYKLINSDIHEPVNIGNPHEMTIMEFAHLITKLTDSPSKIIYRPLPIDDPKKRCPDITKAKKLLNWEPKVPIEEGLKITIDWYKKRV